uniref:Uncharacterized protein n=1 Tax=Avena sativa TaxID=4498 RepID=A0ACD5X4V9_AVESA
MNMFDAQLDAIRAALDAKGYTDVEIVIAETGWPYKGDPDEAGATPDNAKAYNGNLVAHLKSEVGTPRTPGKSVDTYIFALYDEDLKPGPVSERSFGLYQADLTANYDIGLAKGSGNTPSTSGQIGVTPAPAQVQAGSGVTPTGFCVTTGSLPGSTQQEQQGGSCYMPAGAEAQTGHAGMQQLVWFGILLSLAMLVESR